VKSLKHGAGFLSIDHRDSPGLSARDVAHVPGAVAVGAGRLYERDVKVCTHCQRAIVLEPLRTRDRGYCNKCDHYICDHCEAIRVKTGACIPFLQTLDRMQALAEQGNPLASHDLLASPELQLAVKRTDAYAAQVQGLIRQGRAHYDAEEWDEAEPYFHKLLDLGVHPGAAYSALSTISLYQGKRTDALSYVWKSVDADPDYQASYDNLVMVLDADPSTTMEDAQNIRELWWQRCGAKLYETRQPHANDRDPNRPLRVGYVSGDFCHHSACSVFGPMVLAHSGAIEPYFYSSTESYAKDYTTEAFSSSPRWRDVWGESDDVVADLIRRDCIDLLIDLSGYTANNRLAVFARKVAPVQITGWGYGTGLGWPVGVMDYLIADAVVVPPDHRDITEAVACLPSVLPYFPAERYTPIPTPLPMLTNPPTFGVFQRALKINDESLKTWRLLLERAPEARLIIKGDYCRSFVERMQAALAPMLERVSIINIPTAKADHLAMWAYVDISLDTWPQSGGVASCESLWHGVPVVTLQGDRLMSRVASSLLTNLGLTEFIAKTPEEYVQCAITAIANPAHLGAVRQALPGIYADWNARTDYVQIVEDFYRSAWQKWCAG
jgi:predicted O-linked N-acetylglucosamine transferase (SPINDLY family)